MSDPVSPAHPDGTPRRLGRYRLVRPISTGGMARVFEGRRESLAGVAPRVAVKVILPDYAGEKRFRHLFINEARIGSMLRHQNLVQIQDFDCEQGVYYLVMEYVEGLTLRRCMSLARRNDRTIRPAVVAELGRQLCEGLHHAHGARSEDGVALKLVHRDIKPSNLILNPQGVVKILDFGISKAALTEERRGAVRGTWGYMAPEQAGGLEVGPAADLFGVAAVLYELAALRPLFPEKGEDEIRSLLAADEAARRATRLMGRIGSLGSILVRALQRDPAARYQSAVEMGRALGALLPDPVTARESVERFQAEMAQLDGNVPAAPVRAAVGQPASQGLVDPLSLPVAAGESPRDVPMGPLSLGTNITGPPGIAFDGPPRSLLAAPSDDGGSWRTATTALFVLVALAIIGFTGWRLVGRPEPALVVIPPVDRTEAPAPSPIEPDSSEELVEVEDEPLPPAAKPPAKSTPAPVPKPQPPPKPTPAPAPAPQPAPAPAPPAAAPESPPPQVGRGRITISSIPKAQVIVDGKFIRNSPLYRFDVAAGTRVVTLIDPEGRRKTFSVPVPASGEVRRVWSFDEDRFME